jgi:hypothetical protein
MRWQVFLLSVGALPLLAAAPPPVLPASALSDLKALKMPVLAPRKLPQGYQFKKVLVDSKAKTYRLDFRCFCGGMNYLFSLVALPAPPSEKPTRTLAVMHPTLGTLQLGIYSRLGVFRLNEPGYMTTPLALAGRSHLLVSALEGRPAPEATLKEVVAALQWLKL